MDKWADCALHRIETLNRDGDAVPCAVTNARSRGQGRFVLVRRIVPLIRGTPHFPRFPAVDNIHLQLGEGLMPLSWNEIRERATRFSKEWDGVTSERADAQTFWNEFFEVFGITRRRVAVFEKQVELTRAGGRTKHGWIDAFWKGTLLVEHKSAGENLDKAVAQAADYFAGIKERDLPRYIIVSNFERLRLYDLEADKEWEFAVAKLRDHVALFGFIAGYETHKIEEKEEAANIKAAEQLGKLHDLLKASSYSGHPLEVLLVRLLFCLFADDTGIFDKNQFREYLEARTSEDGSDLGMHLGKLFEVLNTPKDRRSGRLDEQLAAFTYVNGRLFDERLPLADFDSAMREALLDASGLDWSAISPAIFGSLFQSIMDKEARRNLGAHYTREVNILKALRPLFLDELTSELDAIGSNQRRLIEFQKKLASTRILDPACGCGNFLVIAYRELRLLELELLRRLYQPKKSSRVFDVKALIFVDVDQLYGIEIEEFPAQIAQVALWLTDHQMNMRVSDEFGEYFARLPLTKSPNIMHSNALRIRWEEIIDPIKLSYIVGNPPFVGKQYQTVLQKEDLALVMTDVPSAGLLDYVAGWYIKAARYTANTHVRCAFVSTNSITQGEQVSVLWSWMLARKIYIHFAHRTFQWSNEARNVATVQCVIVGFGYERLSRLTIFEYDDPRGDPHAIIASNINPYLVDAPNVLVTKRASPPANVRPMLYGSKPVDEGNFILTDDDRARLLGDYPQLKEWIRPFIGTDELLYGASRWCLWLEGAPPAIVRIPEVYRRIEAVRVFRRSSKKPATRRDAATPTLFAERRQPSARYLAVPEVSGERRRYFPIAFLPATTIASNKLYTVANATNLEFGILSSSMHFVWMSNTSGRLESRFQYSASLTYNNFPWPEVNADQRERIAVGAQGVLDERSRFPSASLAELYDPVAMPPELVRAHQKLDRAVDLAYGKREFESEAERAALLFTLYEKLMAAPSLDFATPEPPTPRRKRGSRARAAR